MHTHVAIILGVCFNVIFSYYNCVSFILSVLLTCVGNVVFHVTSIAAYFCDKYCSIFSMILVTMNEICDAIFLVVAWSGLKSNTSMKL